MPNYPRHLHWLDSFRFLAALMVVISHTRNAVFVEYGLLPASEKSILVTLGYAFTRISNEAVIMFFVLSGFLVGGRATQKIIEGQFSPSSYAIDRFSRIMVPLVPALALTAVVVFHENGQFNVVELLGNLLSLQGVLVEPFGGNNPLWSLSYEVWFYVMVFAVGLAAVRKGLGMLELSILVGIFVIFCFLAPHYLFCWLIGALIYFMPDTKYVKSAFGLSLVLVAVGMLAIQLGSGSRSFSTGAFAAFLPSIEVSRIIFSAGLALFVRLVISMEPKTFIAKGIDKLCSNLAKASYTLYLTHFPLIHFFGTFGLEQASEINVKTLGIFIGVIVISVLFSLVFYYLFERHTLRFRNYLKQKWSSDNSPAQAGQN